MTLSCKDPALLVTIYLIATLVTVCPVFPQVLLLLQEEKEKITAATQVRVDAAAQDPQAGVQKAGSVLGGMGLLGPNAGAVFGNLGLPSHKTLAEISTPMPFPFESINYLKPGEKRRAVPTAPPLAHKVQLVPSIQRLFSRVGQARGMGVTRGGIGHQRGGACATTMLHQSRGRAWDGHRQGLVWAPRSQGYCDLVY